MFLHISTFGNHRSHGLRENLFTDRQTDTPTQTDYNNLARVNYAQMSICLCVNHMDYIGICTFSFRPTVLTQGIRLFVLITYNHTFG